MWILLVLAGHPCWSIATSSSVDGDGDSGVDGGERRTLRNMASHALIQAYMNRALETKQCMRMCPKTWLFCPMGYTAHTEKRPVIFFLGSQFSKAEMKDRIRHAARHATQWKSRKENEESNALTVSRTRRKSSAIRPSNMAGPLFLQNE